MSRLNSDLLAIKAELTTDPTHLGLTAPPAIADLANANLLMGTTPPPVGATPIVIFKTSLTTAALFNAIDPIEHQALSDQQRAWLAELLTLGQFNPSLSPGILTGIQNMFATGTLSRAATDAQMKTPGDRIDQMFQAGL